MVYRELITLINGRLKRISFKDVLKIFRISYTEDINIESNCVTEMYGFDTNNGIEVEGCLEVL